MSKYRITYIISTIFSGDIDRRTQLSIELLQKLLIKEKKHAEVSCGGNTF